MDRSPLRRFLVLGFLVLVLYASIPWAIEYGAAFLGPSRLVLESVIIAAIGFMTLSVAYYYGLRSEEHHEDLHRTLDRSIEAYAALFDATPDGIFVTDGDLRFRRINRAGAKLLGASDAAAAIGTHLHDLLADPQSALELAHALATQGVVERFTLRVGHGNAERVLELTCQAHRDEAGAIASVDGIFREITARVRAEEKARERFEKLQSAYRELGKVNRQFASLLAICRQPALDKDVRVDHPLLILRTLGLLMGADEGHLYVRKDRGRELFLERCYAPGDVRPLEKVRPYSTPLFWELLRKGRHPAVFTADNLDAEAERLFVVPLHDGLVIPCLSDGEIAGYMTFVRKAGTLRPVKEDLLQALSAHMADALAHLPAKTRIRVQKNAEEARG